MPTVKQRVNLTVSDELYKSIEDTQYKLRLKSKSETVCYLLNIGLEEIAKRLPEENRAKIDMLIEQTERASAEMAELKDYYHTLEDMVKRNRAYLDALGKGKNGGGGDDDDGK